MTVRFIPIDVDTPQEAVVKRLAHLLAEKGVADTAALSTAIDILVGIQAAIDSGDPLSAIQAWDTRKQHREAFMRKNRGANHDL